MTVNVAQATPTVSVNPVNITYGTALANSQLSGTATWTVGGNPVTVPGTFTYTSAAGTVLGAGNGQSEAVTFTPSDRYGLHHGRHDRDRQRQPGRDQDLHGQPVLLDGGLRPAGHADRHGHQHANRRPLPPAPSASTTARRSWEPLRSAPAASPP